MKVLIVGNLVMVIENIIIEKGLVNGSIATIHATTQPFLIITYNKIKSITICMAHSRKSIKHMKRFTK